MNELIIIIILILIIFYFAYSYDKKNIEKMTETDENLNGLTNLLYNNNINIDNNGNLLIKTIPLTVINNTIKFGDKIIIDPSGNTIIDNFDKNLKIDPSGNVNIDKYIFDTQGTLSIVNSPIKIDSSGIITLKEFKYDISNNSFSSLNMDVLSPNSSSVLDTSISESGDTTVTNILCDEIEIIKYAKDNNINKPLKLAHCWFGDKDYKSISNNIITSITSKNMYAANGVAYNPIPTFFNNQYPNEDTSKISGKNNMDNGYVIKFSSPVVNTLALYNTLANGRDGIINTHVICKLKGEIKRNIIITPHNYPLRDTFFSDPITFPTPNDLISMSKPELPIKI